MNKHILLIFIVFLITSSVYLAIANKADSLQSLSQPDIQQAASMYPPDTTLSSVSMSNLTRPGYLSSVIDPIFKTKITRISDQQAFGTSNRFVRHNYAKRSPWNSDDSLIFLEYTNLRPTPLLDGNTYKLIKKINLPGEPIWSNTNPKIIYGISNDKLVSVNVDSGQQTELSTSLSGIQIGPYEGNISNDDKYVVLNTQKAGANYLYVFDISSRKVIAEKSVGSGDMDWASISASGKHVVVMWRPDGSGRGSGVDVYDTNLNYVRHIANNSEHGDLGIDANGNDILAQFSGPAAISIFRLDGTGAYGIRGSNWPGGHISCRNTRRPGWCYFSDDSAKQSGPAGTNEVFAFRLDTSGVVQRFAHQHQVAGAYDYIPVAVPNRAGSKVIFASDWGSGSAGPVYSYIAEMPGNTNAPPTIPVPLPTISQTIRPSISVSPLSTIRPMPSVSKPPTPVASTFSGEQIIIEAELATITTPFQKTGNSIKQAISTDRSPTSGGKAEVTFSVPASGLYAIYAVVDAPNIHSNSFYINSNNEPTAPLMIWDIQPTLGFEQRTVGWRGNGDGTYQNIQYPSKTFNLSSGKNTLIIRGREPDVSLDKIIIKKLSTTSSVPPIDQNFTKIEIQAYGIPDGGVYPRMNVSIKNKIHTFAVTANTQTYTINHPEQISFSDIKIIFPNDSYNGKRDLIAQSIRLTNKRYPTSTTYTFNNIRTYYQSYSQNCPSRYTQSGILLCNGEIRIDEGK